MGSHRFREAWIGRTRKWVLCAPLVAGGLALGSVQALAYHKDPDTVDPAQAPAIASQLVSPPAITTGSTDTAPVGIGTATVGAGDLTTASSDPPSSHHTYFVDNNPSDGDCPATPYTTIQAGVNASGPGDKVIVCPGTYAEQVVISGHTHDGLTLRSLQPLKAVIQWPTTPSTNHQLVDVTNANDVSITAFTISGPFPSTGCSPDRYEGVLFDNAFGGSVERNHITLIRDANSALYGCQQGDAVAIGHRNFNTAGSAIVDHNLIDRYQKNGVQAVDANTSALIVDNTITGSTDAAVRSIIASNGVVVFMGAQATVVGNVVSQNQFSPTPLSTGIILDEAPSGSSEIEGNLVYANDYGVEVDSETNLELSHNDVLYNLADGITLCGDATNGCSAITDVVVRANDVDNNGGSGIYLNAASANLVKANWVDGNGPSNDQSGIHADSNSSHNNIVDNDSDNNAPYDCQDDSTGTGTAGTANTWQGDEGDTSSPPGICTPDNER